MKDIEKVKKLFTELGIGFTEDKIPSAGEAILDCKEGDAKIDGYNCFYTRFVFDQKNGSFKYMGAWE